MMPSQLKERQWQLSVRRSHSGCKLLCKENSIIDQEAYTRGTSVYLVDRVIPMLPKELSMEFTGLNPNEDRLAFSVLMEIDNNGTVVNHKIEETVIRSSERMVYEDVTKILEDNDPELIEQLQLLR